MAAKRLNLGAEPHLQVERCGGNLEVRGWNRDETLIETPGVDNTVQQQENGVIIATEGRCTVRLPEGASLTASMVEGNLRVRDVRGSIEADQIGGTLTIRHTGPVVIGRAAGQLSAREVDSVSFEQISGHVSIRDVPGSIAGDFISGNFSGLNIPGGAQVNRIGGNLSIRTDCRPETHYLFQVGGNAEFRVPEGASVRFVVRAGGPIKADNVFQKTSEGRQSLLTLGSGASVINLEAGGSVRLKQRGSYDMEGEEFYLGLDEFSDHLEDTFGQLDSQFSNIEEKMDLIPPHVRGRLARKMDAARRRMVNAQKRVVQTMQSAQRDFNVEDWSAVGIDLTSGRSHSEPVTEQERLLILQMLEDGKITVTEAQKLLDALEGRGH